MRSQLQHLSSTSLALALGKAAHAAYDIGKKYIPPIIHTIQDVREGRYERKRPLYPGQ